MGLGTLTVLAYLVRTMVERPADIGGLQLLTSSIAVWVACGSTSRRRNGRAANSRSEFGMRLQTDWDLREAMKRGVRAAS